MSQTLYCIAWVLVRPLPIIIYYIKSINRTEIGDLLGNTLCIVGILNLLITRGKKLALNVTTKLLNLRAIINNLL